MKLLRWAMFILAVCLTGGGSALFLWTICETRVRLAQSSSRLDGLAEEWKDISKTERDLVDIVFRDKARLFERQAKSVEDGLAFDLKDLSDREIAERTRIVQRTEDAAKMLATVPP